MKRMFLVVMLAVSAVFSAAGAGEEESIADVVKQFNQALKDKNFDLAGKLVTPDSLPLVEGWKRGAKDEKGTMTVSVRDGVSIVEMPPASIPIFFQKFFLRKTDGGWKIDLRGWEHHSDYDKVDSSYVRASNLKQIGLGLHMYAGDHDGLFPAEDDAAGLDVLRKGKYLTDPRVYVSPLDSAHKPAERGASLTEANSSYVYFGGADFTNKRMPPQMPIAFEKPDAWQGNWVFILFVGGHVEQRKIDGCKNVAELVETIIKRGKLDGQAEFLRKKAAEADRRLQEEAKK